MCLTQRAILAIIHSLDFRRCFRAAATAEQHSGSGLSWSAMGALTNGLPVGDVTLSRTARRAAIKTPRAGDMSPARPGGY